jgi:hypothetical protein
MTEKDTQLHFFDVNEGMIIEDGKSIYPNYLNVHLDKKAMLQVLSQIANALNSGSDETLIMLAGILREDEPE